MSVTDVAHLFRFVPFSISQDGQLAIFQSFALLRARLLRCDGAWSWGGALVDRSLTF